MSKKARARIGWTAALLGAAALGGMLDACTNAIDRSLNPPRVPLTQGLPGSWDEATAVLDQRLKKQFPVGSSVSRMTAVLARQGFDSDKWDEVEPKEGIARRDEGSFVCNVKATASWRASADGRVRSISGKYHEAGCL